MEFHVSYDHLFCSLELYIRHRAAARRRVWAALSHVPWAQYSKQWTLVCGLWFWSVKTVNWGGTWGPESFPFRAGPLDPPHPGRLRRLQDASKTPPDASCMPSFFWCFFWCFLARFLIPTWLQLASKNQWKSMKNLCQELSILASFFDRFWFDWNLTFY